MSKLLTIDATTRATLLGVREPVALVDEAGQFVGYYSPYPTGDIAPYVPQFSEDDLQRWESEPGGRTLKEIMADLSKLP